MLVRMGSLRMVMGLGLAYKQLKFNQTYLYEPFIFNYIGPIYRKNMRLYFKRCIVELRALASP